MIEQRDVVVIGAGPVGLSLALGLARRGIDVLVLEKNPGTAEHSRAPVIWPRTQQILAELGVIDRFVKEGIPVPRIEVWDADRGKVLLRLPVEELSGETAYPRLLILPQSKTERLLYEAVRDTTGAEVRFSSELSGLEQNASGVEVRYGRQGREGRIRARFVVGCDGAHSKVREELGGSLEGLMYGIQIALADIAVAGADDLRFPRMTTDPELALGIRIGPGIWRLILPFFERNKYGSPDKRIADTVRSLFHRDEYQTQWQSEFRLHGRVSSRWVKGRIVLAGDAAHLISPVGGQGMNAGILDAQVLGEALVKALATDEGTPLMDYAGQRRKAIEREINPFTNWLTRLLLAGNGRFIRPIVKTGDMALRISPLRRRVLRRLAMLEQE